VLQDDDPFQQDEIGDSFDIDGIIDRYPHVGGAERGASLIRRPGTDDRVRCAGARAPPAPCARQSRANSVASSTSLSSCSSWRLDVPSQHQRAHGQATSPQILFHDVLSPVST